METEPVIITAIMLSDSVIREHGSNKISLLGCFAMWNAPIFPFQSPPFVITPFISNLRGTSGELTITVKIENSNRHCVWSTMAKVNFQAANQTVPADAIIDIPFRAAGVQFPTPDRYTVRVLVNADEIGHRDITVRPITVPNLPTQPT